MKVAVHAFLLTLFATWIYADNDVPDPRVDVLHYDFNLVLSDTTDRIDGVASVQARFIAAGVDTFVLDLDLAEPDGRGMRVSDVSMNGKAVRWEHRQDELILLLAPAPARGSVAAFTITYSGVPADGLIVARNRFGSRTFFGDNWPDRAHYWLPVVDHPLDKATSSFAVTAPSYYRVVSNGTLISEVADQGRTRTQWRNDRPLPTKVMVIGAARFAVDTLQTSGPIPIYNWVYEQNRNEGFSDMKVAGPVLEYFTRLIGEFPYPQLSNVQSTTRYGGMENAGAIFYAENAVTGTGRMESVIAHEIAHQWFGDAVSEADWHHVWLSEGFATYLTLMYAEQAYGNMAFRRGMEQARQTIFSWYRDHPGASVIDTTITDLNDLLSPITYEKGAWVLHMLRSQVGDDAFRRILRTLYETHRDGNALTSDLALIAASVSGKNLDTFFREWLYQPGYPIIRGTWWYDAAAGNVVVQLTQQQSGPVFTTPIEVAIVNEDLSRSLEIMSPVGRTTTLTVKTGKAPKEVVIDPGSKLLMDLVALDRTAAKAP